MNEVYKYFGGFYFGGFKTFIDTFALALLNCMNLFLRIFFIREKKPQLYGNTLCDSQELGSFSIINKSVKTALVYPYHLTPGFLDILLQNLLSIETIKQNQIITEQN